MGRGEVAIKPQVSHETIWNVSRETVKSLHKRKGLNFVPAQTGHALRDSKF